MARKTILMLALSAVTAASALPLLAQTPPAAPDCAADPAACQALVDRMGQGMGQGQGMGRGMDRDDDDRPARAERRGGDDDDRGKGGKRGHGHGHGHWGGEGGGWNMGMTQRFDTDADGSVSADEAAAGVTALVTQFDTDGDGALTVEEFGGLHAEMMKPMTARAFGMLDNNADGRVDAEEATAAAQRMMGGRGWRNAPARQAAPAGTAPGATAAPAGDTAAPAAEGADPAAPATAPAN